jgi:hypothetical protein
LRKPFATGQGNIPVVKTTPDLKTTIDAFVSALSEKIEVDRVFLWGAYAEDKATEDSDIRLIVISPSFDGVPEGERINVLGPISGRADPLIQAWGYTPRELDGSESMPLLLAMALHDGRQVYPASHSKKRAGSDRHRQGRKKE